MNQNGKDESALIAVLDKINFEEAIACAGTNLTMIMAHVSNSGAKLPYRPDSLWFGNYLVKRGYASGVGSKTEYFLK